MTYVIILWSPFQGMTNKLCSVHLFQVRTLLKHFLRITGSIFSNFYVRLKLFMRDGAQFLENLLIVPNLGNKPQNFQEIGFLKKETTTLYIIACGRTCRNFTDIALGDLRLLDAVSVVQNNRDRKLTYFQLIFHLYTLLKDDVFNSFMTEAVIIQKPVH